MAVARSSISKQQTALGTKHSESMHDNSAEQSPPGPCRGHGYIAGG